jgi:segregation and condensation protein A
LADFLVVAAKLLLIKSRVLLPQPEAPPQSEEDEGEDLVRQLIEYRRFKEAARHLREIEALGQRSYIRLVAMPELERTVDLGDVTLDDLLQAVLSALSIKPPAPSVNGTVSPITVTVSGQMALIERETARGRAASFVGLLKRAETRLEIIVTLLALLEMVKQLRVTMRQDGHFGDILIVQRETGSEENGLA